MRVFINILVLGFVIYFGSWFFVYKTGLNTLTVQSEDTLPAMVLPANILRDHTLYANTFYYELLERYPHPDDKSYSKGLTPFYFKKIIAHDCKVDCARYISAFPLMTGFAAVPVYLVPYLLGFEFSWDLLLFLSHIASALIMAVSGGLFYLLVNKYFDLNDSQSYLVTVTYMFGSINYALVSQALWQHGTVQLFIILGLLFLYDSFRSKINSVFGLGLAAGFFSFAILSRPTAVIAVPFLFLLCVEKLSNISYEHYSNIKLSSIAPLVMKSTKLLLVWLVGFIPAILFFVWYNNTYYVSVLNQGYSSQVFDSWITAFPEGFLGLWASPSKGILVFSPIFFLSIFGAVLHIKKYGLKESLNVIVLSAIVIVHTLLIGMWKHWYGGWSFGYRMASDILPYLALLLVYYIKNPIHIQKPLIYKLLLTLSILVQVYGMIFFDGVWHAAYDKGFKNSSWLWSLENSEWVFNARRVLVKLDILDKACDNCLPKIEDIVNVTK